ncbi:MAG: DUF1850 domain-containing protein [Syntrophaceae bacterium]|nr:DUF1850 domain-containing protein [Syntrophaceae bacterium]
MPRWIFLLILFFIIFPPSLRAQGPDRVFLLVESRETRKVLLKLPLQPGECFQYEYIHSSDHTPVRDTFRIEEGGKITLLEEAFLGYGAGLEFQDHREARLSYTGSWTRVQLNRGFSQLPIRVGRVARQILAVRSQIYRLDELARPGDCLILSISD